MNWCFTIFDWEGKVIPKKIAWEQKWINSISCWSCRRQINFLPFFKLNRIVGIKSRLISKTVSQTSTAKYRRCFWKMEISLFIDRFYVIRTSKAIINCFMCSVIGFANLINCCFNWLSVNEFARSLALSSVKYSLNLLKDNIYRRLS